jgi:hypothetical protein
MSYTLGSLLAVAALVKKKESPIEPFKRTARLVDDRYAAAVLDLECATTTLIETLKKKLEEDD